MAATTSDNVAELAALAEGLGFSVETLDDVVEWYDDFPVGSSMVPVRVEAWFEEGAIVVEVHCIDFHGCDERLLDVELERPLVGGDTYQETDPEDPELVIDWLVIGGVAFPQDGAPALRQCLDAAYAAFRDLAEACIVRLVNAGHLEDGTLERAATLEAFQNARPREALDAALDVSDRCHAAGDYWGAAYTKLAAAEAATDIGEIGLAEQLAEPAWSLLGAPLRAVEAVGLYVRVAVGRGDCTKGLRVLDDADAVAEGPSERAHLRYIRGVALAICGNFPEAISILAYCVDDPDLVERYRNAASSTLAELRQMIGVDTDVPRAGPYNPADDADHLMNRIATILTVTRTRGSMERRLPELDDLIARVYALSEHLGRGQRARLLMAEAAVALHRGDIVQAGRKIRLAGSVAVESGDAHLIRSGRVLALSIPNPDGTFAPDAHMPHDATAYERMMFHFSRSYYPMLAAIEARADLAHQAEQLLPNALEAVLAIDGARHEFAAVSDRRAFAPICRSTYHIAIAMALILNRIGMVIELVERQRAQGLPAANADAEAPLSTSTLGSTLDNLVVGQPTFAASTSRSELEFGRPALAIRELVAKVAGTDAWWWTCSIHERGIAWVVRKPEGDVTAGFVDLDAWAGRSPIDEIAAIFKTPASGDELVAHALVEDRDEHLDALLDDAARLFLPPPLREALLEAAETGEPLNLVWAPAPEVGNLPIAILPLDANYRVLHGAVLTAAPPTSLVAMGTPAAVSASEGSVREWVVVGHEEKLQHAEEIVGPRGLATPAERVLGPGLLVGDDLALAGATSTPEAVLRCLHAPPTNLLLYYGHVDEAEVGLPLSTSLRLTDGNHPAALDAAALLTADRHAGPAVVVLCGCSSFEPASVGSGEWWGFAVGLLWQGSRTVVGSLWALVDCPATARFAVDLVRRLRSQPRPAVALRDLQLEWLREWEQRRRRPFTRRASDRHPILWAGWTVTGVG